MNISEYLMADDIRDILCSISESLTTIASCMDEQNKADREHYGRSQYGKGYVAGLLAAERRAKEAEQNSEEDVGGEE